MSHRFSLWLACALVAAAGLVSAPASAQTWESAPAMSTARTGAAWAVLDGRLYVVGGRSAGGTLLNTAEVFTPGTGWSAIASLEHPRVDARAVVLGGALYLLGGQDDEGASDDVDVYRPGSNDWDSEDNMESRRAGLAAGVVNGQIFAIGGTERNGLLLTSAERFANDDWNDYSTWNLAPARALAGSVELGASVVVAGGFSQFGPLDAVLRFVPGQAPASLPSLPSARGGVALASGGGALLAVGGRDVADTRLANVDRLSPGATSWTALPALPEAREGAVAAVLGTDLYVVGGTGPFGTVFNSAVRLANAVTPAEDGPAASGAALTLAGANPTRGPVRLRFETIDAGPARLVVVDVQGRQVAVLSDGIVAAGPHTAVWEASNLPSGVYAALLTTPTGVSSVRFVLVR